jgi:tRNA (guanine-N7-)-methyltransferase
VGPSIWQSPESLSVEIGTGYGEFMLEWCEKNPGANFVGLDHRFKRSFQLAKNLIKITNKNFRYLRARGERLEFIFATRRSR